MKIISNVNEIKSMGEYYIRNSEKQLRIDCKVELIRVYDITAGVVYIKQINDWDSYPAFKEIVEKVKNLKGLVEYLAFQSSFQIRDMKKNEILNPFFELLTGELKIKSKTGRFTKAQVKKILKHRDTIVVRECKYTDDYAYDAQVKYEEGVIVDKLSMLEEVDSYFDSACTFKNGEFSVFTGGMSTITKIINKNIKVVA